MTSASPPFHLGVIAPPTNTVNEAEWRHLLPEHIGMTFVRMALHAHTDTPAGQQALRDDLAIAMDTLAAGGADVVTYACTAGSMTTPHDMPHMNHLNLINKEKKTISIGCDTV